MRPRGRIDETATRLGVVGLALAVFGILYLGILPADVMRLAADSIATIF